VCILLVPWRTLTNVISKIHLQHLEFSKVHPISTIRYDGGYGRLGLSDFMRYPQRPSPSRFSFPWERWVIGAFWFHSVWEQTYLNIHKQQLRNIPWSETIFFLFQPTNLLGSITFHLLFHAGQWHVLKQCSLELIFSFLADLNANQFGQGRR
jgi:hypothetical protein